jgi:hypothetical protein
MDELKYSFKPTGQISVFNIKPNYSVTFQRNENGVTGKEVGKFDFNGPKMVFTGDAEESAKVFIEWVARSFAGRLEDERKAAQPAAQEPVATIDSLEQEIYENTREFVSLNVMEWLLNRLNTTPPAAQPAVPDAIHHTDLSEHPQYIEGWNDCRAEMLKGMKP